MPDVRPTGELRLADIATFLSLLGSSSISGAARAHRVTPSQITKAIQRLERCLGVRLLLRGARGVSISPQGKDLVPRLEDLVARARALADDSDADAVQLTFVSSAFLNALFLPGIVERMPGYRLRCLELPPGLASAYASEHAFDVALTTGVERWPASWVRARVGLIHKRLHAAPSLARRLGRSPIAPSRLSGVPFVGAIYSHHGQIIPGDDGCPLAWGERRFGHQTQTLSLALDVAARTEHLVFAPAIAARPWTSDGRLVEISVVGWQVSEPLTLVCDGDRVKARAQREIVAALRATLGSDA